MDSALCPECRGFGWIDILGISRLIPNDIHDRRDALFYLSREHLTASLGRLQALYRADRGYDVQEQLTCICRLRACESGTAARAWVLEDQPRKISADHLPLLNRAAAATDDFLARMHASQREIESWLHDHGDNFDKVSRIVAGRHHYRGLVSYEF